VVMETNALGFPTSYTYDALGRRTSETDANGDATYFGYDLAGRMTRLEDPLGNVTEFAYNDRGQLVEERVTIDGATYSRTNSYDTLGNLTESIDRQGRRRVYEYDELLRPRREYWYNASGTLENTITTTYDVLHRVVGASDNSSSYAYGYDALDRLTTETVSNPGVPTVTLTTTYDRLDGLRSSFSATIDGAADFRTTFGYDGLLRMTDIVQTGQGGNAVADKHVVFTYNDNSQFDSISRYASTGTTNLVATSQYAYDSSNRLTALAHSQGATSLAGYTWTFDGANRLVQMTSPDGTANYTYDSRDQLVGAGYDYQDDESYVYDENGNRITATYESTGTDTYATGDHNRLVCDGTFRYEYDPEGNRTARFIDADSSGTLSVGDTDVTEYTWDNANRLIRIVERATADGPATSAVDYLYDLYGRRIGKQLDTDGDGIFDRRESYIYDQTDIILDFVDADGDGTLGTELTKRYLWGAAVDQLLAQEDASGTGSAADVLYPLTDHLGTIRDLGQYDEATATTSIIAHYVFDAFGNVTAGDIALMRYLWTTQEYDPESGLYFFDARYLDSKVAKFIGDDPKGINAGDPNFSRFLGNTPTNTTDPSGYAAFPPHLWEAQRITVSVSAQGYHGGDFAAADAQAADIYSGFPGYKSFRGATWDHAAFDSKTFTFRMELVKTAPHGATGHRGGFADYLDWAAEQLKLQQVESLPRERLNAFLRSLRNIQVRDRIQSRLDSPLEVTTSDAMTTVKVGDYKLNISSERVGNSIRATTVARIGNVRPFRAPSRGTSGRIGPGRSRGGFIRFPSTEDLIRGTGRGVGTRLANIATHEQVPNAMLAGAWIAATELQYGELGTQILTEESQGQAIAGYTNPMVWFFDYSSSGITPLAAGMNTFIDADMANKNLFVEYSESKIATSPTSVSQEERRYVRGVKDMQVELFLLRGCPGLSAEERWRLQFEREHGTMDVDDLYDKYVRPRK